MVSVVRTQDWSCKQGGPREALDNIVSVVVACGLSGQDSGLVMQTGGTKGSTGQYSICGSSMWSQWSGLRIGHANRGDQGKHWTI